MKRWLAALAVLASGCPKTGDDAIIRVAADRSLQELGLIEYLLSGFEEQTKIRTKLEYDATDDLEGRAASGDVDDLFVVSQRTLAALQQQGLAMRLETYAHEEFVLIGPFESPLGEHGKGSAVELMQDVTRANYKTLDPKKGSLEYDKVQELFVESGDRQRGGIIATELEGTALVKQAVESRAFALVKRSSLLQAASQGSFPHRIYREADPDLVLRIAFVEVHPAKTHRTRKPELFDWLMGEKGKALVENFGERQFGYPVFGVGEPEEGKGAHVPELRAKKGLEETPPDPEQASP